MTSDRTNPSDTIEARLQAWIDGEATQDEARALEAAVATDDDVRRKRDLLAAVTSALEAAAPDAASLPAGVDRRIRADLARATDGGEGTRDAGRRMPRWIPWWIAAAAVVLVGVMVFRRDAGDDPALDSKRGEPGHARASTKTTSDAAAPDENEYLALHCVKEARKARLFDDPVFTIELRAKQEALLCVLPRRPGMTPKAMADAFVKRTRTALLALPVYVDVTIVDPDGRTRRGHLVLHEDGSAGDYVMGAGGQGWGVTFRLSDVIVPSAAPVPYVAVFEDAAGEKKIDTLEAIVHYCAWPGGDRLPSGQRWMRYVIERPGRYRVTFHLDTVPKVSGRSSPAWPSFERPLESTHEFVVGGHVGAWSEPVDGMRMRVATAKKDVRVGDVVPIGLQLQNVGKTVRRYNFMGLTRASIPQPYHFTLWFDGTPGVLDEKAMNAVAHAGEQLFAPHVPGAIRTIVVPARFWQRERSTSGPVRVGARFHFEPSLWSGDPKELWRGTIDAPPIECAFNRPDRR